MSMPIKLNEYNKKARGGTELLIDELVANVDPDLLDKFQIIPGRYRGIDDDGTIPIYWVHDTHNDPEMAHLANGGWSKFRKIVFVSYWQMNTFLQAFNIPRSMCAVLHNAVPEGKPPVELDTSGTIKLVYHTTPHRGLELLSPIFDVMCEDGQDVTLDVYSSFKIYGWEERDSQYQHLFDSLKSNPKVNYHGTVSYETLRSRLPEYHIFAYPCIWPETGCRSMMEATMDGPIPVHTDLACLPETAANMTIMYPFDERLPQQLGLADAALTTVIKWAREKPDAFNALRRANHHNSVNLYGWKKRSVAWNNLLKQILHDMEKEKA
jgi:glycosyltransferase involved in cell wall biosynthesis